MRLEWQWPLSRIIPDKDYESRLSSTLGAQATPILRRVDDDDPRTETATDPRIEESKTSTSGATDLGSWVAANFSVAAESHNLLGRHSVLDSVGRQNQSGRLGDGSLIDFLRCGASLRATEEPRPAAACGVSPSSMPWLKGCDAVFPCRARLSPALARLVALKDHVRADPEYGGGIGARYLRCCKNSPVRRGSGNRMTPEGPLTPASTARCRLPGHRPSESARRARPSA
jgi:hypothetical protein